MLWWSTAGLAFFYNNGRPEGICYEAQGFERTLKSEYKTDSQPLTVTFLPAAYDQLEKALTHGEGARVWATTETTFRRPVASDRAFL